MTKGGKCFRKARTTDELVKALKLCGWREAKRKRRAHVVLYCGCGEHSITVAVSASDWRAVKNLQSYAKQCDLLRQEVA